MSKITEDKDQTSRELDEILVKEVKSLKEIDLTEDDFQLMESRLQQVITEQGAKEMISEENQNYSAEGENNLVVDWMQKSIDGLANWFSWKPMKLAGSMSAAFAVLLSVVFVSAPSQTAFASVLSEMQQASSMYYSSIIESNGEPLMDVNVYYREPGHLRVETLPKGNAKDGASINVLDLVKGKGVIFFPGPMFATTFEFAIDGHNATETDNPLYWYEQLKNYQGEPVKHLQEQTINGHFAEGFVINENGANITVWADVSTHLPIKLIVTLNEVNGKVPFEMIADLKYNQVFDDSLFSLEISDEYQVGEGE